VALAAGTAFSGPIACRSTLAVDAEKADGESINGVHSPSELGLLGPGRAVFDF
jgi:hypothetical protein